jgi:VCBS repeat-containing protein
MMSKDARVVAVITLLAASLTTAAPALAGDWSECDGHFADITGTSGDDVLYGTPNDDVIAGGGGNDIIYGLGGNDIICGETGADLLVGNSGNDRLFGGGAADRIEGGYGDDVIDGGYGKDDVFAGPGADAVTGGPQRDRIFGEGGDDTLSGDGDDDLIKGGLGKDEIRGGAGSDSLHGQRGADVIFGSPLDVTIDGGLGIDQCVGECELDFVDDAPVARDDAIEISEDDILESSVFSDHGAGADYHPDLVGFAVEEIDHDGDLVGVVMVTGHGATLRVDADGTLRYDPRAALDGLDAGQSVVESFTYEIEDEDDEGAVASVTIVVHGVDDAPVAVADAAAAFEDGAVVIDVVANDTDVEGDSFSVVSLDLGETLGSAVIENGAVHYTADGDLAALGAGEQLEDVLFYEIAGPSGGSGWGTVTITVTGANDAPVAFADIMKTMQDTETLIEVLRNDVELDASDVLTVTVVAGPAHGSAVVNPDGSISYQPDAGYIGTDTLTYQIVDSSGETSSATVNLSVVAPSDPGGS